MSAVKKDKLGRRIQPTQGGGNKPLPVATNGALTGQMQEDDCPPHLDKDGQALWKIITATMRAYGILEKADATIISLACECFSRNQEAGRMLREHGLLIDGLEGLKRNPAAGIKAQTEIAMKSLLSEIGLTPASRAKFGAVEDVDPLQALLNGKITQMPRAKSAS